MDDQYEELLRGYNYERKVKEAFRDGLKLALSGLEAAIENAKKVGDPSFLGYAVTADKIRHMLTEAEGK